MNSYIQDGNHGILFVDNPRDGYINIVRYMSEKDYRKNKSVWDICIAQNEFSDLILMLEEFIATCANFEINGMKEVIPFD